MASRLHARSGLLCPAFLGLILYSSCSVVKEDRTDCPCALTVEVSGLPSWPVSLSFSGENFREQMEVGGDTTLLVMVPKSGVQMLALSGTSLPQGKDIQIPRGFDCPPLYLHTEWLETPGDSARVKVQLHKHFCKLSLTFDGPPGWGEPYWTELRGRVEGLSLDGEPIEGDFSCRLDRGGSVRLPRQSPQEELWLDIAMPDRVVRSFALGNYLLQAGYDWTAADLEDQPLQIDLSVTNISFRTGRWSTVIPLEVEI